jgi:hypothetical protein
MMQEKAGHDARHPAMLRDFAMALSVRAAA